MPYVNIYKKGALEATREFNLAFYVSDDDSQSEALYWNVDDEPVWETDNSYPNLPNVKKAPRHIWILENPRDSFPRYRIKFVRPEWTLKVLGIECKKGLYEGFNITWKQINLLFGDYEFEFLFSQNDIANPLSQTMDMPTPVST